MADRVSDTRSARRVLMVFVDGLGLGVDDPVINPVSDAVCPNLCRLLSRYARPIDAGLGVPGLPQSASVSTHRGSMKMYSQSAECSSS